MAKSLTEMAAEIVQAQASHSSMSPEEMKELLEKVFFFFQGLKNKEEGVAEAGGAEGVAMDPKKSIKCNKVICLECGKEFKQLTNRHLKEHGLTTREYRKKYGFSARQPLSAKLLTAKRRKAAMDRNLGEVLKKAREKKAKKKA
ncbi:MAG: MucR family transcriptional regulator [Deltaproteobacteria bacterium]|nr:MucR family transcriptional regulator [Deltaproteobacteria bacterium]